MFKIPRFRANKKDVLYKISLIAFFLVFIGFIIITPIDTIIQSKQTNQVWNVFIILAAWVIAGLISFLLYGVRIVRSRRILADIPKRYLPRFDDLPRDVSKSIVEAYDRCAAIVRLTKPAPLHKPSLDFSQNASFSQEDIIIVIGRIIEAKASNINDSFKREAGLSLREYLAKLDSYNLFENLDQDLLMKSHDNIADSRNNNWSSYDINRSNVSLQNSLHSSSTHMSDSSSRTPSILPGHSEYVAEFAELYEELRFSGKPIMEDDFNRFMTMLVRILRNIDLPDNTRNGTLSTQSRGGYGDDIVDAFVDNFDRLYAPSSVSEAGYMYGDDVSRVTSRLSAIVSDKSKRNSNVHNPFYTKPNSNSSTNDRSIRHSFNFGKHLHPTDSNLISKTRTWLSYVSSHRPEHKYQDYEMETRDNRGDASIFTADEGYSSAASSVIRYNIHDNQPPSRNLSNHGRRLSLGESIYNNIRGTPTTSDRQSVNSSEYEGSVIIRSRKSAS